MVLFAPILDLASTTLPCASITRNATGVWYLLSIFNVKNVVVGFGMAVTLKSSSLLTVVVSASFAVAWLLPPVALAMVVLHGL
jgi:hypothetical protein